MGEPSLKTPDGLDLNLADPDNLADAVFYEAMARLRETAPVYWSEIQRAWIVSSHAHIKLALSDPRFSAQRQMNQFRVVPEEDRERVIPNLAHYNPDWITNSDGDKHLRLRRLVTKAFSRKVVENLRPQVQTLVDQVLDEVEGRDEVDFVADVAYRIPATVIVRLLGLPDRYIVELRKWAKAITALSANPGLEALLGADRTIGEMNACFREEFALRRQHPTEDLLSELLAARDGQDALTEEELLGICHILIIAGHNTTANAIAMGLMAFVDHPDQKAYYMANPEDGLACMTEMLRFAGMSTAQVRMAAQDLVLSGQAVRKGDALFLMLAAANRDPAVFERPDVFDCTRPTEEAMTFGPGFHHCVGHLLARMELDVFFRTLFGRFRRVELLEARPRYTPTVIFRGPESLRVRLRGPAAPTSGAGMTS